MEEERVWSFSDVFVWRSKHVREVSPCVRPIYLNKGFVFPDPVKMNATRLRVR